MKRIVLLVFCLILLSGCSIKLIYNQLDWLIPWYLEDYISFTSEQNAFLDKRLTAQLRWHRGTQLPSYAAWLMKAREDLRDGLTLRELDHHSAALQAHLKVLARQITPDAASLLTTASDAQVQELLANLDQKNQDYQSEYVDVPEQELRQKRAQLVTKHFERWIGAMTPAQHQAVADWSQRFQATSSDTLQYRKRWQAHFRQALAQRHNNARFSEELNDLLFFPENMWSVDYQRKLEFNRDLFKTLILKIDHLMSVDQRDYLSERLASLAGDFAQLAKAGD